MWGQNCATRAAVFRIESINVACCYSTPSFNQKRESSMADVSPNKRPREETMSNNEAAPPPGCQKCAQCSQWKLLDTDFSKNQRSKGDKGRCKACVVPRPLLKMLLPHLLNRQLRNQNQLPPNSSVLCVRNSKNSLVIPRMLRPSLPNVSLASLSLSHALAKAVMWRNPRISSRKSDGRPTLFGDSKRCF